MKAYGDYFHKVFVTGNLKFSFSQNLMFSGPNQFISLMNYTDLLHLRFIL
jgi:hypothetical protein